MSYQGYDRRIAGVIKALRQYKGIKQIVIANSLHISQSAYSKIENGCSYISPGQLALIAEEMSIPLLEILVIANMNQNELACVLKHFNEQPS